MKGHIFLFKFNSVKKKYHPVRPKQHFLSQLSALLFTFCSLVYSQESKFISFIGDTHISSAFMCTPDGKSVYAGGLETIVTFKPTTSGFLEVLQVFNNNLGIEGIHHIIDFAVSPDGRYLYAININDQSLLLFSRNKNTGALIELKDVIVDSVFGKKRGAIPVVERNYKLLLSPDGKHLYWLYSGMGLIAVFERNSVDGLLTKIQVLRNGTQELGQFDVPYWITISPDGRHLYGGGGKQNGNRNKLLILTRDEQTGLLSFTMDKDVGQASDWTLGRINVSPDGNYLYTVNSSYSDLRVFIRNNNSGALQFIQDIKANGIRTLVLSPDGKQVYAVNFNSAEFKKYFALYSKDASTGKLILVNDHLLQIDFKLPQPPSSICMSPSGSVIYMTNDAGRFVIQRDTTNGDLAILQHFYSNVGGTDRLNVSRSVEVSPDGNYLYVAAQHVDAGITTFKRNHNDGSITLEQFNPAPKTRIMVMPPDGKHLYITQGAGAPFTIFDRDAQTGQLKQLPPQTENSGAHFEYPMAFSPRGKHLYVTNTGGIGNKGEITVHTRNNTTGELTTVQKIPGDDYNLYRTRAITVSPDGAHVYWSGENSSVFVDDYLLATFSRDSTSGQLSFVESIAMPLDPLWNMTCSPDGRHLYATTIDHDRDYDGEPVIIVYNRDTATGKLTQRHGFYLDGWCEISDLSFSADGQKLYVIVKCDGYGSGLLAILDRDGSSGRLTMSERHQSWKDGVYGMAYPNDITLSPDEKFLYIGDNCGVTTFTTGHDITTPVLTFETPTPSIPLTLSLEQNYPNPFYAPAANIDTGTTIRYNIAESVRGTVPVNLSIYNMQGQLIQTLVNKVQTSGRHSVIWDGRNAQGRLVPSGVYFYRMTAGGSVTTKRIVLMK